jgi:hypothetical protein
MKNYTVYFELFGRKMKHRITAKNEEDAKYQILGKVVFHSVKCEPDPNVNVIKDFFGFT